MASFFGTTQDHQLIIPVTIANPDRPGDRVIANGLVDTGSTACSIRESILDDLNIKRLGYVSIRLITGKRTVGYYKSLLVFGDNGSPSFFEELVSPLPTAMAPSIDVIIGMSVIAKGELTIKNGGFEFSL